MLKRLIRVDYLASHDGINALAAGEGHVNAIRLRRHGRCGLQSPSQVTALALPDLRASSLQRLRRQARMRRKSCALVRPTLKCQLF